MAASSVKGVRIAGVASAVPETVLTLEDDAKVFGRMEIERISQNIGVKRRHVVREGTCTSDLCFAAAARLLDELPWPRDSVDAIIFVSQTADYFMPATACVLQDRLRLARHCAAFDVNQGCAGYVYGLWIGSQLVRGGCRRLLLLAGDTTSRLVSPRDRTVASLFGDAGTATALEVDEEAPAMHFELGTDGSGRKCLMVPAGAFRQPHTAQSSQRTEREGGNIRGDEDLVMDGGEVFTFALREVPRLVQTILSAAGCGTADIDAFVFHQANHFMLNHLAKRLKLPQEKVAVGLTDYGNTSSASIPLAITTELREALSTQGRRLLLAGFGAGFSWAASVLSCGPACVPPVLVAAS
ncbi:MAG: ketoacyl-ACP synthase III [Planctomycetia bacterium]|nr:ketoacyl-ACP synthase III [Planctomycetia bacterium]